MTTAKSDYYKDYSIRVVQTLEQSTQNKNLVMDILGFKSSEYEQFLSGHREVDTLGFANLADEFNFSLRSFSSFKLDFETLREHAKGNTSFLPSKYSKGANSRKISLINILNYLEHFYGSKLTRDIYSHFQIHPDILNDPLGQLNFLIFDDLFEFLISKGLSDYDIFQFGIYSAATFSSSELFTTLKQSKSLNELYEEYMNNIIPTVEQNNHYRVTKLNSHFIQFESHENEEMLELFKVRHLGSKYRCVYRAGILSGASQYIGKPFSYVTEEKCVHRGDCHCTFTISFT